MASHHSELPFASHATNCPRKVQLSNVHERHVHANVTPGPTQRNWNGGGPSVNAIAATTPTKKEVMILNTHDVASLLFILCFITVRTPL